MATNTAKTVDTTEESALAAIAAEQDLDVEDELLALIDDTETAAAEAEVSDPEADLEENALAGLEEVETPEPIEAEAEAEEEPEAEAEPEAKKPAKEAKAEAKAEEEPKKRAVKRTSTANMACADAIAHKLGNNRYDVCIPNTTMAALEGAELEAAVDEFTAGLNTLPKKVREKVVNLFSHVNDGVALSNYTVIAMKILKEKGEMSTDELRQAYKDRPYSDGTANAQSSQIFQLLPALEIANRDGKNLTLNPESVLKDML